MNTADDLIRVLEKWVGIESNHVIIDNYNNHIPLPRNYKVKYTDQWCATGISSAIYSAGMEKLIGVECSCQEFINIFKSKGIWFEDGSRTPQKGDIILYNWDDTTQPNDGWADHIGLVTTCHDKKIVVLECNYHQSVNYRTIPLKWCYIRGFARPNYSPPIATVRYTDEELATQVMDGFWGDIEDQKVELTEAGYNYDKIRSIVNSRLAGKTVANKTIDEIAKEVIAGKWGNGATRKKRLLAAGMDYLQVQFLVSTMLKPKKEKKG